ncbi:hypothetical protein [Micromonospora sp. U21]|uniref:hypothetical protein n=1 Tax=Micromonospora sp. U21 TaxID=2824899 RepID=UPI001B3591E8|nr:hypothetical protein [Micromonospora sp. U21]MBQ0902676.1 hypothetical protein [Micromonospora sp. U21]
MKLPPLNPDQRRKRSAIAHKRRYTPDDPDTIAAQRDFRAERAEDYIRRLVDEAPPLTEEQRARLAALLTGGGGQNAAA